MIFKWETEKERVLKHMYVSPKKKLVWLEQMHKFIAQSTSKRNKLVRWKLRRIH